MYSRLITFIFPIPLLLLSSIQASGPCEDPCVDDHLKAVCRGMYNNDEQLAQHFNKIFYGSNEEDCKRNLLAVDVILWHRSTEEGLNNIEEWKMSKFTKKFRVWTLEFWEAAKEQLDNPYCYSFVSNTNQEILERIHYNFAYFYFRIIRSIEEIKTKDYEKRYKNITKNSFQNNLEVRSILTEI
uniref:Uncharacterized protein n=1 Tax=Meloidogyne hapla TaxID=6305 RepID=A0A1I8BPQ3_MELHA